ncbi:MAG: hypothetical protein ACYC2H_02335 [Thermoplasmatota archaeon]
MQPSRAAPVLLILLAALLALPAAQAALNGPRPYTADPAVFGYMPGLSGPTFTMASGRMEAVIPSGEGTWGFFATAGATLSGLTRVCWTETLRECRDSSGGGLSIHVLPGGSFGMDFPTGADATFEAGHALAMFADLTTTGDLNSLDLGLSLLAPAIEGKVVFTSIPEIPASLLANPTSDRAGVLAATELRTVLEVREGETVLVSRTGKVDPLTFAGRPAMTPIATELAVVPFRGSGAVARFQTADKDDAAIGLDLGRINRLMGRLYAANEGSATEGDEISEGSFGPFQDAAASVFGGAVLSLPSQADARSAFEQMAFARTPRLEVRGTSADGLTWTGKATIDIHDGHVEGAQKLYGIGFIALPWWGWLLWVVALTVWIVRLVRKPEKAHPTWDRFKWIGWVAAIVVAILVFVLWDLEMKAVLGVSLLSSGLSAQLLLLVGALQIGTFGLLSFAAIAPLRILLRNGSLLLHQGTFMGLAGAVAGILGFLIGFGLLRSGFDLILSELAQRIA